MKYTMLYANFSSTRGSCKTMADETVPSTGNEALSQFKKQGLKWPLHHLFLHPRLDGTHSAADFNEFCRDLQAMFKTFATSSNRR